MAETNTTTADAVNHLVDKIGDGLAQISAAISTHAPQAWELVVRGNYAHALVDLGLGGVELIGATVCMILAVKLFRSGSAIITKNNEQKVADRYYPIYDDGDRFFIGCGILTFATVILTVAGLLDASAALPMLISPDGTTARDLLLKAL